MKTKPTKLMSLAQLQGLVRHAAPLLAFHAAMVMHTEYNHPKPSFKTNPMNGFTTGQLREFTKAANHDLVREAFESEIARRREFSTEFTGHFKSEAGDITWYNRSWCHPERPLGGDDSYTIGPDGMKIRKEWPDSGLGTFAPDVIKSAA